MIAGYYLRKYPTNGRYISTLDEVISDFESKLPSNLEGRKEILGGTMCALKLYRTFGVLFIPVLQKALHASISGTGNILTEVYGYSDSSNFCAILQPGHKQRFSKKVQEWNTRVDETISKSKPEKVKQDE